MADDQDAQRPRSEEEASGNTGSLEGNETATVPGAASAGGAASEIERLERELAAAMDRLLRERAELENYKKRVARERRDAARFGSEALLRDLLPILDDLHRALDHARGSRDAEPIVQGIEMVLRSLDQALERHGVHVVVARGTAFNPNVHEAVGHVASEHPPNTVIEEHRRGYLLHDRLLRPAQVTVGKGRATSDDGVERPKGDG